MEKKQNVFEYFKQNIEILISDLKNKETRIKQIPNLLTLSRLLSPVIIIPLLMTGNFVFASISVVLFELTDWFDGFIAKKYNAHSEFGRLLDAFTDKIFVLSLIIPLLVNNISLLLNLLLEGIISIINIKANIENKKPKTIFIGKIKTAFLFLLIAFGYLSNFINVQNIALLLSLFTTTLQVGCIVKYSKTVNNKKEILKESNKEDNCQSISKNLVTKVKTNSKKKKYEMLKKYLIEEKRKSMYSEISRGKVKSLKKENML